MADSHITILPDPPHNYPRYRMPPPPMSSYPRYNIYRDVREYEEDEDVHEPPAVLPMRRQDREHVRSSRHVPVPAPPPPSRDDRDGRSSRRISRDSRDGDVNFKKACKKLKKLLQQAINLFGKLEKEFQEETKLIEKYASKRILDDLWRRKIGVDQDLEDNDDLDDLDADAQTHASRAYTLERRVVGCLSRIVEASVDGRKNDIERQLDILLQTKIEVAMQCIAEIWPKIDSSRKQCRRLLTELGQLFEVLRAAYPEGGEELKDQNEGYNNSNAQKDAGRQWAS